MTTHQHNDNEHIVACQFTYYLLWKHLFFGIYKVTPTFSFKLNVDANFEKWYSAFCWQCVPYPLPTTEHQGGDEVSTQIFCFLTFPYLIFALRLVVLIYLIRLKIMACSFQILHILVQSLVHRFNIEIISALFAFSAPLLDWIEWKYWVLSVTKADGDSIVTSWRIMTDAFLVIRSSDQPDIFIPFCGLKASGHLS